MARPARKSAEPEGFWHRPEQMRFVASALLFAGVVGLGVAGSLLLLRLPVLPVKQVTVLTSPNQVSATQLEYALLESVSGNFATLSLDRVRLALEKLPWVRGAVVRRIWPDRLEVELEEHVAVARWKQGETSELRMVNLQGELFTAPVRESLPLLAGPPGRVGDVLVRYREFVLAVAPSGQALMTVTLNSRDAWSLRLNDGRQGGLQVELGRDQPKSPLATRLTRFIAVAKEAQAKLPAAMAVADLRYPNGFAVRLDPKAPRPLPEGRKESR